MMCEAFAFRLLPEASSDESLIKDGDFWVWYWLRCYRVGYSPETKSRHPGQDVMKSVASRLPDSVALSRIETST